MEKQNHRDYREALCRLIDIPLDADITTILHSISRRRIEDVTIQNKVFQYLRKIKQQTPEHDKKIASFLANLRHTKFKTFKFKITNAFANDGFMGTVAIYLNNQCIINTFVGHVVIQAFWHGITADIPFDLDERANHMDMLDFGCGYAGCCPSLFWNMRHDGDHMIIDRITMATYAERVHDVVHIPGEYMINAADYRSEVERLLEIHKASYRNTHIIPWQHPSRKWKQMYGTTAPPRYWE
nr:hypothetical protein [Candidatus Sigynarchaeota archaeon]